LHVADFCLQVGQYALAVEDYTRSLELNPSNIKTFNNRGYSYAKSGNYEAAIADYDQAIQLDPSNSHAYHNRGISFDKLGQVMLLAACGLHLSHFGCSLSARSVTSRASSSSTAATQTRILIVDPRTFSVISALPAVSIVSPCSYDDAALL
jgi:tetratricopeptide (TPR) repeat protein